MASTVGEPRGSAGIIPAPGYRHDDNWPRRRLEYCCSVCARPVDWTRQGLGVHAVGGTPLCRMPYLCLRKLRATA